MTCTLTRSIPETATANSGGHALNRYSEPAGRLPKFVDHPELKGRWAYARLFVKAAESTSRNTIGERDLLRFRQMHFCGRRMKTLRERYGARAVRRSDYERFARLHQQFRDDIASDNLGLVYSLYKQSRIAHVDGDELLSEGMMALTRAIDTFNPWRGFRFSTYACNAIQRAFYRCGLKESKRREREPVNFESRIEKSDWLDTRRVEASHLYVERLLRILSAGGGDLTGIEKDVLAQRFPIGMRGPRRTLSHIGQKLSLSKERVRQIEKVALVKLRAALDGDPVLNPEPRAALEEKRNAISIGQARTGTCRATIRGGARWRVCGGPDEDDSDARLPMLTFDERGRVLRRRGEARQEPKARYSVE
ncbi:MAG: sigma-70 family RNA polymerase sigma factor [Phycisphaerae bacterium]|nr:sigma-70 family RNA polymerase sigma factor [Phycisphaerae bacterium]